MLGVEDLEDVRSSMEGEEGFTETKGAGVPRTDISGVDKGTLE